MASGSNLNFNCTTAGVYCSESYGGQETNCYYGFKVTIYNAAAHQVKIQFGLMNPYMTGGKSTYYGYTSGLTINDNHVTVNSSRILLGDSHDGKYNYTGITSAWKDCSGMEWIVTLSGGSGGNVQTSIPYSMEMNDSCYKDGASGTITIAAGIIDSSYYASKCSNPTTVGITQTVIVPTGSFKVTWSGAKAGNNNSITGYRVYYTISSGGSAPTTGDYTNYTDVSSTSTSGEVTITLSSAATRGYIIVAGVRTKCSNSSYWADGLKSGGSCSINKLPNAPTVTSSASQYVPSTGGSGLFKVTAGTDPNGQDTTIWYNTSSSSPGGTQITGGSFTGSCNSSTNSVTYYIWTKDSLGEFSSSYATAKLTRNTTAPSPGAPTVTSTISGTSSKVTGVTFYSRLGSIQYSNLVKSTYATAQSNTGTLTVTVYYRTHTTGSGGYSSSVVLINGRNIGNKTSTDATSINLINSIGWNKDFYIEAVLNDGIESGSTTYGTASSPYRTAPEPTIDAFYNRQGNANVSGSFDSYFYKTGRVYFSYDSMMSKLTLTFSTGASATNATKSFSVTATATSSNTTTEYVDFDLSSQLTGFSNSYNSYYGGKTLTLTKVVFSDNYNTWEISSPKINNTAITRTMIYIPTLGETITGLEGTYKPYTDNRRSSNFVFSIGIPSLTPTSASTGITGGNLAAHGLTNGLPELKLYMVNGSKNIELNVGTISFDNSTHTYYRSIAPDTTGYTTVYSPKDNRLSFNLTGDNIYQLQFTITNAFGYTQTVSTPTSQTNTSTRHINFAEKPKISTKTGETFQIVTDTDPAYGIKTIRMFEGLHVNVSFKVYSYNAGTVTCKVTYPYSDKTITMVTLSHTFGTNTTNDYMSHEFTSLHWPGKVEENFTTDFTLTVTNATTNLSDSLTPTDLQGVVFNKLLPATMEITTDSNAQAVNDLTVSVVSNTISDNCAPQSGTNIEYVDSYTTTVYADQTSDPTTVRSITKYNGATLPSAVTAYTSSDFPTSIAYQLNNNEDVANIKVVTVHTITENYKIGSTVKYSYSIDQIVTSNTYSRYGLVPTVSYRKNHIAINNAWGTTSSDVVVISAIENRRQIRLIGLGNVHNVTITLPTVASDDYPTVDGLVIDGGSW